MATINTVMKSAKAAGTQPQIFVSRCDTSLTLSLSPSLKISGAFSSSFVVDDPGVGVQVDIRNQWLERYAVSLS